MSPLAWLAGCAFLTEQRTDPTEITWSGWVLVDLPDQGEVSVLDAGFVEFETPAGEPLGAGGQPYATDPGWWRATLPADTEVAVRVGGSGSETLPPLVTTVWRGRSPEGAAIWLDGALYTRDLAYVDAFLADLSTRPGGAPEPLSEGKVAHLWGEPLDPEAWAGAEISVTGGDGAAARVLTLAVGDDGELSDADDGPVDIFLALDLPPGTTRLSVQAPGVAPFEETWPTRGGDLLSAIYTALPEDG